MVTDKPSQPTSRDEFQIAIVCSRAREYDVVSLLFDEFWDTDGDPFGRTPGDLNTYTTGYMGNHNIVLVLLCSSGKSTTTGAAAGLRSSYPSLELIILAGICEGVPDANGGELLLGDVVICETVVQYDLSAFGFKEKDALEGQLGGANMKLRSFTTNMKTEIGHQRLDEKVALYLERIQNRASETKHRQRRKAATYVYPGSANDILFESAHCHRHYNSSQCVCADYSPDEDFYAVCDESKYMDCEQTGCRVSHLKLRDRLHQKNLVENAGNLNSAQIPSIFFGRFGSGDTAFSSGIHRDSLAKRHSIVAFEVEETGVWDELPCILVKGVSNYGDGHKTKHWEEWQNFAAATAASVARALVERYPHTDKSPYTALKLHENKACLNALFITNPEDDKQRIEETKGGLLSDVYIWITRSEELIRWLEDAETRLLWIKGDPGKGKTMLLCGIINELRATKFRSDIYYFFCQATDIRLNNASAILRGLLHMMVVQQPSLISYIREEYDKSGKSAFEGVNSWIVLSRIFGQMLGDDSLKEPIFLIDALDECVTDLAPLLELIVKSSSSSIPAKWLVSSRNEADIQEVLTTSKHKSTVSLELNGESVSTAIDVYIRHKVQLLSDKRDYAQSVRDGIENYLSANANGTFLWVALVCALLEKVPRYDPLPKSADFPPGLGQVYERMISRVYATGISDVGRRILAIATVAYRPLTKQEFIPLINAGDSHDKIFQHSEYDWEDMLSRCGSFLTERNGTIYFLHQSAKDFIINEKQRLFPRGMEYVHRKLLEASISIMRNNLRKDIYGLVDPGFSIDDLLQHTPKDDPLIPIKYSCVYWIDHFEQSMSKIRADSQDDSKCLALIHDFLMDKYIYWLEALSLLRRMSDGMVGMQRLEQLVANAKISGLLELVCDARRFMQTFGNAIGDFPLQVYVSALVFSPTRSIVRRLFRTEVPKWIQTLPDYEVEWAPSSRTYEGSMRIDHLATSYCGTWIASICDGTTIAIWQISSGKIFRVLDACPSTERQILFSDSLSNACVCFSPWNSEELSSSWLPDGYVTIWDVTTGIILRQLQVENGCKSISYLTSSHNLLGCVSKHDPHGMIIASIWNTRTGQMLKKIEMEQLEYVYGLSVCKFSPIAESKIARLKPESMYSDRVEILNFDTGSTIHVLTDKVKDIEFSPDGSILALQTDMPAIILSDTTTGKINQTIRTKVAIHDFTFSSDGKLLAIATAAGIWVFSITSGECLRMITMKSKRLIFSSDGRKIFSANDTVINVVEMDQESLITPRSDNYPPKKRISERDLVSISPNRRFVASMFTNPLIIEVMDINSNLSTRFQKNFYSDEHRLLQFSHDSNKLAMVSDSAIVLWDISAIPARITSTLEKPDMFTFIATRGAFAFSSDSQHLTTTLCRTTDTHQTYRFKVEVWDTGLGECSLSLGNIRDGWEVNCAFSPDSKRLAISWIDRDVAVRVEIWDIASASIIQSIHLNYLYLKRRFNILTPRSGFWSLSDKEDQGSGEEGVGIHANWEKYIDSFSFLGEGYLILDIHSNFDRYSRAGRVQSSTDLRIILRMKTDLELQNSLFRLREANYEVDSGRTWIEFKGKRLVWIPPQYRNGAKNCQRNCVALSRDDGPLFIIHFHHSEFSKQIALLNKLIGGHVPRLPEIEAYTYLRELDDDWDVVYFDMNGPDKEILEKIEVAHTIKKNTGSESWDVTDV